MQFFGLSNDAATALDVTEKLNEMQGKTLAEIVEDATSKATASITESLNTLKGEFQTLKDSFTEVQAKNTALLVENEALKGIEDAKAKLEGEMATLKQLQENEMLKKAKELESLNAQLTESRANERHVPNVGGDVRGDNSPKNPFMD